MIKKLYIKNYALFQDEVIEFTDGLNILMGETGAGKSMVISSLEFLFGSRSDSSIVRYGEKKAIIEGYFTFENSDLFISFLQNNSIDLIDKENIIIRREVVSSGGSRAFINDIPVSISILKQLGYLSIDFHGQHEHQSLLNRQTHITFLDSYAQDKSIYEVYKQKFLELEQTINEYKQIIKKESNFKHQLEYDKFRLNEINTVEPKENEYDELNEQLKVLQNAEFITNTCASIDYDLYDSENSVYSIVSDVKKRIQALEGFNPDFANFISEIETSLVTFRETASFSKNFANGIDFNPEHIESIRQRLTVLKNLMKKYGSLEEIFQLKEELEKEVNKGENFEQIKNVLIKKISDLKKEVGILAQNLHKLRKTSSRELSQKIIEKLSELGIPNAQFASKYNVTECTDELEMLSVSIEGKNYYASILGIDDIEFYISTNLGQLPQPLVSVASGGEISRIMLSIKSIFATISQIPILIFDEIDTGISGRIALKSGLAMKTLAESHQIIAVTHLPQIAALGQNNILIEKFESDNSTYSKSKILDTEGKIEEVAKLISGGHITSSAKEQALELINTIS